MDLLALAHVCAPMVSAKVVRSIVQVESGQQPWAIHVNGPALERQPRTNREAVATARWLSGSGWNFDMGLAQINVRNADRFGLSIEQAFDPCTNLRAMQRILQECFARAAVAVLDGPGRLAATLSCYNTGDLHAGLHNGYVQHVVAAAGKAQSRRR